VHRADHHGCSCRSLEVDKYMLFREHVLPDYKHELQVTSGPLWDLAPPEARERFGKKGIGFRTTLNSYKMVVSAGKVPLEKFTQVVWETLCFSLVGETLDPAECINGAWLEDVTGKRSSGKKQGASVTLSVEIWFAIRDDAACKAICDRLIELLQHEMDKDYECVGLALASFKKTDHFQTKHVVRVDYAYTRARGMRILNPTLSQNPPAEGNTHHDDALEC
jgi:hypothetical protein